jgi:hypothetical protein
VLRVSCALESLDSMLRSALTPADVEQLALADFCFLDELYRLAFLAAGPDPTNVQCGACGGTLVPARWAELPVGAGRAGA